MSGPLLHLAVSLELVGGWNGDLYAHPVHASGFAVLLNRIGRTSANTVGSGTAALQAVFIDSSAFDIHPGLPANGLLTGTWQPDARTADPELVTHSSPRRAFPGSFAELAPSGRWTLFPADLSPGGTSILTTWSLHLTTVSEPGTGLLTAGAMLFAFRIRKRQSSCYSRAFGSPQQTPQAATGMSGNSMTRD